jgi:coenzyme F420-0:L-glutamate ligase/coenzyme F420-1:gamma-L-glutamate ligase
LSFNSVDEEQVVQLILTALAGIPMIQPGDDLAGIIEQVLVEDGIRLVDGDVIIVAQKVISKAEGRLVDLRLVQPSAKAVDLARSTDKDPRMVEMVLQESHQVLRSRPGTIIVEHRLGFICANAGIDRSNVFGDDENWVLLLPADPDASANQLRMHLERSFGASIGVLIIDSHGRAWRMGTVGITIGISGLPGVVDLRGQPDLFNYRLQITEVGAADELAAAASLMMGQAAEGTPIVHARGFPYALRESCTSEILRPREQDLFR